MIKEIMYPLAWVLFIFFYCGRTTINSISPYIHVEYPFRGLFVVVGLLLIAYYSNQIKF